MACATLKRSHDWDPLQSPTGRSPKRRRQCSSSVISPSPKIFKTSSEAPPSPFGAVASMLTSEQIASNIREEIKKLHRRKQLRFDSGESSSDGAETSLGKNCTFSPLSLSHSDGSSSAASSGPALPPACRDQPLFTFRQVGLICERMIKERENQIREEYDGILNAKLAEQYDTFVKFTYDQIQKRYENCTPSYLS